MTYATYRRSPFLEGVRNCTGHVVYYLFHTAVAEYQDEIIYRNHRLILCTCEVWEFQGWEASLLASIPVPQKRAEWQENTRGPKWAKFTHDKPTFTTSPFLKQPPPNALNSHRNCTGDYYSYHNNYYCYSKTLTEKNSSHNTSCVAHHLGISDLHH